MNGKTCEGDEEVYDGSILKKIDLNASTTPIVFNPIISVSDPGTGLEIRPLQKGDFHKGFPQILTQLTTVGDVSEKMFLDAFERMKKSFGAYYVTVIENKCTEKIIGSATLLLEQKFIHECALRGRVEDVVVCDEYRGKQLGKLLLTVMVQLSKELGCYKVSLDCKDKMIPFYEGFGFKREQGNGNFMTIRF